MKKLKSQPVILNPLKQARRALLGMRYAHFFSQANVIFIHIPKAAGISVFEGLFARESFGHYPLWFYQRYMSARSYRNCFKCAFVRNPYDRLYSAFNYMKRGGRGRPNDLKYQSMLRDVGSFEEFVLDRIDEQMMYEVEHLIPQCYWLRNMQGAVEMDYIGRFKTLAHDYAAVALEIGSVEKSLKHLNVSQKRLDTDVNHKFTPSMIKKINDLYAEDFSLLDYPRS
jgi:hypothetical protein